LEILRGTAAGKTEQVIDRLPDQGVGMDLFRAEALGGQQRRRGLAEVATLRMSPGNVEVDVGLALR
jgi:hypothetical protein